MCHTHNHHDSTEPRRYTIVLLLAALIFIMEMFVGSRSHSLALVGDAWHVLADAGAIGLALGIALFVRNKEPHHVANIRKYGAYIQGGLLYYVCFWMFKEAIERLQAPKVLDLGWVITIATLGTVGNWLQHRIVTKDHGADNITKRALDVHILSDLAQSVAVVMGTLLIVWTKLPIIDPILSFGIAIWMSIWTTQIVRAAGKTQSHCCTHQH
ncbi:MAG TPA: cation diffusion facilitator family transporter [Candidatus Paceibacterota bacterium]|nr:cation diffusion facilitator family transporter [Candidatus Paceibacterota bacterium]